MRTSGKVNPSGMNKVEATPASGKLTANQPHETNSGGRTQTTKNLLNLLRDSIEDETALQCRINSSEVIVLFLALENAGIIRMSDKSLAKFLQAHVRYKADRTGESTKMKDLYSLINAYRKGHKSFEIPLESVKLKLANLCINTR